MRCSSFKLRKRTRALDEGRRSWEDARLERAIVGLFGTLEELHHLV